LSLKYFIALSERDLKHENCCGNKNAFEKVFYSQLSFNFPSIGSQNIAANVLQLPEGRDF